MAKNTKSKQKRDIKQLVKYAITGAIWFWSGYLAFFIFDKGLALPLFASKTLANITGWTVNYYLEKYWVFYGGKSKKKQPNSVLKYSVFTIFTFLIDYMIVASLKTLGLSPYLGQFVSAGLLTVWNYIGYKLWVFKESK